MVENLGIDINYIKTKPQLTNQRNIALSLTKSDIMTFLDDGLELEKDYIRIVIDIFNNESNKEIIGAEGLNLQPIKRPFISRLISLIFSCPLRRGEPIK